LLGEAELATLTLLPTAKAVVVTEVFVVKDFDPVPITTDDVDVTPMYPILVEVPDAPVEPCGPVEP
jgi:hypothetical protein